VSGSLDLFQHFHLAVLDGVGVVIALDAAHISFPALVVEALHLELPRLVQVNGLLVQGHQSPGEGHLGDDLVLAGGIHHTKLSLVTARRLTASAGKCPRFQCQAPAEWCRKRISSRKRHSSQYARRVRPEAFAVADGQLEGRASQVADQDFQVVGLT